MKDLTVRVAEASDSREIVATHMSSFPGFFLSTLGPRFLRHFYEGISETDSGVLLVAVDSDRRILGFVGGAIDQVGFYQTLLRERLFRFLLASIVAVVRHPKAIPRLLRARSRGADNETNARGACLMTLGVRPEAGGRGIGQSLVREFENHLAHAGETSYILTTDAEGNDRVNAFYKSLGLELRRVITTPEHRRLNEYHRSW